jgi:hypothetical protein
MSSGAVRLALWLGVIELVTWGILYARGQRWGWLPALTAGAINGLFGLVIVSWRCSCTERTTAGDVHPYASGQLRPCGHWWFLSLLPRGTLAT